ncbi:hypothetical protein LINGRAHAP2_LOCUS36338 [Linum grandiflorum]
MKTSNIFLLFLVTFFVIAGNEVVIAARINGGKCKVGTAGGPPPCVQQACYFQCNLKYGSPVTGQCEGSTCACYGPC